MPWPSSTPGGAWSPYWGGYVKLWARAAIASGETFHIGTHARDRLNDGNVLAAPALELDRELEPMAGPISRLWIDLSCDVRSLDISAGASSAQGVLSKPDASVCSLELADPDGIYDPLSRSSPYAFAGRSRLMPGVPLEVHAEVVNGTTGAVSVLSLFVGRVESWGEDLTPNRSQRVARVMAVDATNEWVRFDQPEQPAQGAGETTAQRIARLVAFFVWSGTVENAPSSVATLQATTLAATGWELLNRAIDDELGYCYFTPAGALRWLNRDAWTTFGPPVISFGCEDLAEVEPTETLRDVLVDASPSSVNYEIRNAIYAARAGGVTQTKLSPGSIDRFGQYDYRRTDLGLETDAQVATWADAILNQYSYPQVAIEDLTFRPALDPRSWELYAAALALHYVSDLVRIVWAPPDRPADVIDGLVRVVGHTHKITRRVWETKYVTAGATSLQSEFTWTIGPGANDEFDAGNLIG